MLKFCRICLDPENVTLSELKFVRNLCYCQDGSGNLHRKCLEEWMEKSGQKCCNQCHGKYNADFMERSLWSYIWSDHDERIKLVQKALYFFNIVHVTLLALYVCFYVPIHSSWVPYKIMIIAALMMRSFFNLKAIIQLFTNISQNYDCWKRRSFKVVIKEY